MSHILPTFLLVSFCIPDALAQNAPTSDSSSAADVRELETIVVSGVQPGPGMWKVSKADHVLWILGTLSPLAKNITWQSKGVEAAIANSQQVLLAPEAAVSAEVGILAYLPTLLSLKSARTNPDGAALQQVVPDDLYARWSALRDRYIGRSGKVEKLRPIFAAIELYDAAVAKNGLVDSDLVQNKVAAAKRARVAMTTPRVEIAIDDPKAAIGEFKSTSLDDLDCFRKTLDRIDTDLGTMVARANAWATGDLDAIRQLPYTDQMIACKSAVTAASAARARGVSDMWARVEQAWLHAASNALAKNQMTFALLPMTDLLDSESYLSKLRLRGYAIEESVVEPTGQ